MHFLSIAYNSGLFGPTLGEVHQVYPHSSTRILLISLFTHAYIKKFPYFLLEYFCFNIFFLFILSISQSWQSGLWSVDLVR